MFGDDVRQYVPPEQPIFLTLLWDEVTRAVRPYSPGKIEAWIGEWSAHGRSVQVEVGLFPDQVFGLHNVDDLAVSYPEVFYRNIARQFGEQIGEFHRNRYIQPDDHIILGED